MKSLITEKLIEECRDKSVAICGPSRAGKTTFAEELSKYTGQPILEADAFRDLPWKEIPEKIISLIQPNMILEGCQVARVLRTGAKDNSYTPEIVIFLNTAYPIIDARIQGNKKKIHAFNKSVATVFKEFLEINRVKKNSKVINIKIR
jgi:hypothetical protein